MTQDIERRILCKEVRLNDGGEGDRPRITGYAALFNVLSEDLGGFREQLSTGAFAGALDDDVRALINHDANLVLGRNKAGTMVLREDAAGLFVEITPPDTNAARDLMELMRRGDVTQMSFAFAVAREDQTWTRDGTGPWLRTIKRVQRLFDVSVVTYPAYPQTSAAARALRDMQDNATEAARHMQRLAAAAHRARQIMEAQDLRPVGC